MSRTLLALLVPDAEPLIGDLRTRLDPSAKRGLGAHITLVYPFLDSDDITTEVLARLRGVASCHAPLAFTLGGVSTFPSTVWLAPEPVDAIAALAGALQHAFPERPQAGPVFDAYVPHLSVARNISADKSAIIATLDDRLGGRGVACGVKEVHVMERRAEGWRTFASASLAGAQA